MRNTGSNGATRLKATQTRSSATSTWRRSPLRTSSSPGADLAHEAGDGGRVRGRIENVLDWCRARKLRDGANPALWRGHLNHLLPARKKKGAVRHHPAMPWQDCPTFMPLLRANSAISARALEFTILTAARTSETILATHDEFDLNEGVWQVPAQRMKASVEHRVPLSERARDIIAGVPKIEGTSYVFAGARAGRPLSTMAMLELLRGMRPGLTVHGFRSTFRDWAAEETNFPSEVVEMALAHTIESEVERAYRRGDLLQKRRLRMDAWAAYCAGEGANPCLKRFKVRLRTDQRS